MAVSGISTADHRLPDITGTGPALSWDRDRGHAVDRTRTARSGSRRASRPVFDHRVWAISLDDQRSLSSTNGSSLQVGHDHQRWNIASRPRTWLCGCRFSIGTCRLLEPDRPVRSGAGGLGCIDGLRRVDGTCRDHSVGDEVTLQVGHQPCSVLLKPRGVLDSS